MSQNFFLKWLAEGSPLKAITSTEGIALIYHSLIRKCRPYGSAGRRKKRGKAAADGAEKDERIWVELDEPWQAVGPLFMYQPGAAVVAPMEGGGPAKLQKVNWDLRDSAAEERESGEEKESHRAKTQKTPEPGTASQVLIAQQSGSDGVALKCPGGAYLGTDRVGGVAFGAEAIGVPEEWKLVPREDGWAVESALTGRFLAWDMDAGLMRCDSESIGECKC